MRKTLATFVLALCIFVTASGCAFVTKGSGSWEVYCGVRTEKTSEEQASVGIELAPVIERMIDNLTDGKTTEAE